MIKVARIDHRLVHGQVAFAWTGQLGITRIIVIDNQAAGDELKKTAINLAKPAGVKLNIFSVDEALGKMEKILKLKDSVMILFGSVYDAVQAMMMAPISDELNLGGTLKKEGSELFGKTVYLDENEKKELRKLQEKSIQLYVQQVPNDKRKNITL